MLELLGGITWPVLPPKEVFRLTNTISAEQPGDAAVVVVVSLSVKCIPLNICTRIFKQHCDSPHFLVCHNYLSMG